MSIKLFTAKVSIGILACLFTSTSVLATTTTAQGTNDAEYNPIWCALRAGVNLDIEAADHCNTTSSNGASANSNAMASASAAANTTSSGTGYIDSSATANSSASSYAMAESSGSTTSYSTGTNATGSMSDTTTLQPQPTTPASNNSYVALGDSVAAGLGLPVGSNAGDSQCGRSTQGYPYLVARNTGLPLTDVACSGATAGDLVTQQRTSGANPQAQLDTAFTNGTPRLMTITAGANDAHWATIIKGCYATDCTGSVYRAAASAYLAVLQAKLYYAMYSIQNRSGGMPPQVILTGYYDPLEADCTQKQSQISASEIRWIQTETDRLNQVISTVASNFSFAKYVPVSFAGHGICSSSPWVQGLNDAAPFHPTATGQRVIANSVINALNY